MEATDSPREIAGHSIMEGKTVDWVGIDIIDSTGPSYSESEWVRRLRASERLAAYFPAPTLLADVATHGAAIREGADLVLGHLRTRLAKQFGWIPRQFGHS
jgi:hypothetical protein